jgi:hypothetical protein
MGQAETIRAPTKKNKALEHKKTDQGKQRYTKQANVRYCGYGSGARGPEYWVMYTGQNEDFSDGYSRIAEQKAPKPHGMLGILYSHSNFYGTSSPTGRKEKK